MEGNIYQFEQAAESNLVKLVFLVDELQKEVLRPMPDNIRLRLLQQDLGNWILDNVRKKETL